MNSVDSIPTIESMDLNEQFNKWSKDMNFTKITSSK